MLAGSSRWSWWSTFLFITHQPTLSWQLSARDGDGNVQVDSSRFPNGIKYLADYAHGLGLKLGIYSSAGTKTCAGRAGSLGYETLDALFYAEAGVDYLKYDNCYYDAPWPQTVDAYSARYRAMRDALNSTGRHIYYSMCIWGIERPWLWGSDVANSWRTTQDIKNDWGSLIRVADNSNRLAAYASPGSWNDLDGLEIGNVGNGGNGGSEGAFGLTLGEASAQFAIWAAVKSPLLLSLNLTAPSAEVMKVITASEVIAVSQDPLGVAADVVASAGPEVVYAGPLSGAARVVVFWNRGTYHAWPYDSNASTTPCDPLSFVDCPATSVNMSIALDKVGYDLDRRVFVRDLIAELDLDATVISPDGVLTLDVPAHGVRIVKLTPEHPGTETLDELWRPWDDFCADDTDESPDDDDGQGLPWQSIAMVTIIVAAAEGVAIVNMRIPATRQATPTLSAAASGASAGSQGRPRSLNDDAGYLGPGRVHSRTWSGGSLGSGQGSGYSRLESVGEEDSDEARSSAERSSEGPGAIDDMTKRAVSVSVSGGADMGAEAGGRSGRTISDTAIKRNVGTWLS